MARLVPLLLFVFAVAAFVPATDGGFLWDDEAITDNPLLEDADGLARIWAGERGVSFEEHYWPVTYTSFWIERRLWGLDASGYRWTNVLLHATNVVLLWLLLRRLAVPGAWLGAALFAAHPVHVESVAWVIERKDVLSAAFGLGAALAFLRWDEDRRPRHAVACTLLFVLGMLSKSIVAGLPIVLALLVWLRKERPTRSDLALPAGLLVGSALLIGLDFATQVETGDPYEGGFSVTQRVQIASRAALSYARTLVWPDDLAPIKPRWTPHEWTAAAWLPVLAVAVGLALLVGLRERMGRGPLVAALAYLTILAPILGLVEFSYMRHAFVADRFQYLASAALLALAGAALWRDTGVLGRARVLLLGAIPVVLAVFTARYCEAFDDAESHARAIVERSPGSWAGWLMLGNEARKHEDLEGALAHYRESLRHDSEHAMSRTNLGQVLAELERLPEAIEVLEGVVADHPEHANARVSLGTALTDTGRFATALEHLRAGVALDPGDAHNHVELGRCLAMSGRVAEAAQSFEHALTLDPEHAAARSNLETAERLLGR